MKSKITSQKTKISLFQTVLSALELHQICQKGSRALTAGGEFHSAPKFFKILNFNMNFTSMNTAFAHFFLLFEQCLFVHKLRAL